MMMKNISLEYNTTKLCAAYLKEDVEMATRHSEEDDLLEMACMTGVD